MVTSAVMVFTVPANQIYRVSFLFVYNLRYNFTSRCNKTDTQNGNRKSTFEFLDSSCFCDLQRLICFPFLSLSAVWKKSALISCGIHSIWAITLPLSGYNANFFLLRCCHVHTLFFMLSCWTEGRLNATATHYRLLRSKVVLQDELSILSQNSLVSMLTSVAPSATRYTNIFWH